MRIARGVNMCNVEAFPYQVVSADVPTDNNPGPVDPPPNPGCTEKTVTVDARTSLVKLAADHGTTTARIMLDNGLNSDRPLTNGQRLRITCPSGTWTRTFGTWGGDVQECESTGLATTVSRPWVACALWTKQPSEQLPSWSVRTVNVSA